MTDVQVGVLVRQEVAKKLAEVGKASGGEMTASEHKSAAAHETALAEAHEQSGQLQIAQVHKQRAEYHSRMAAGKSDEEAHKVAENFWNKLDKTYAGAMSGEEAVIKAAHDAAGLFK